MPLFTLWRSFDPAWTDEDFDRMMLRAISGLAWSPPVYWHRSFGIDKPGPVEGFCVYEADSLRGIERQQRICWVPFIEAREVQEACGAATGAGRCEAPEGSSLFLVQRSFPEGMSLRSLVRENESAAGGGVTWERSYWDPERRSSRCIFAAESALALSDRLAVFAGSPAEAHPVLEEHPSTWTAAYEQMGLPRPWEEPVAV